MRAATPSPSQAHMDGTGQFSDTPRRLLQGPAGTLSPQGRSITTTPAALLQTKLAINTPGDGYEQEADAVAEQVMRAGSPSSIGASAGWNFANIGIFSPNISAVSAESAGAVRRKCGCAECACAAAKDTEETLARKESESASTAPGEAPPVVDEVLSTRGAQLDPAARTFMEARFGHDFSRIQVHADARAAASARAVKALAYTVGEHIVFDTGRYSPATPEGSRLLAHELTHAVQQSRGGGAAPLAPAGRRGAPAAAPGMAASGMEAVKGQTGRRVARTGPGPNDPSPGDPDPLADTFNEAPTADTPVAAPSGKVAALSADELMDRLVLAERGFQASPSGAPINTPKGPGSALGPGYKTYAGVQIVDQEGNQVISAIGRYVGGGKAHAEANAIGSLRATLKALNIKVSGARMMVVVDQNICNGCTSELETFAQESGITKLDAYLTSRDDVTPKTAGRTAAKVGAKARPAFTKDFPAKAAGPATAEVEQPKAAASGDPAVDAPAGKTAAGQSQAGSPAEAKVPVETQIDVVSAVQKPGGETVTDLEINLGDGLDGVNHSAPAGGGMPAKLGIRVTQNAEGLLVAAESTTGQPAALAEAMAMQILRSGAGPAATGEGAAAALLGKVGAGTEGAAGGAAGASRALSVVSKGVRWGGTALFVVITGYQLITAKPGERPRVLAKAAGGLAGGAVTGYVACNLALDGETLGLGVLLCGLVARGVGGYFGSEAGGEAYDAATMTDLDRALQSLAAQPLNVRRLFYSLVNEAGSAGFPMTAEFVRRFIAVVPANLTEAELITLAGMLHATPLTGTARDADSSILAIQQAVGSLASRAHAASSSNSGADLHYHSALPPNSGPDLNYHPNLSFGPQGAGKITVLPGWGGPSRGVVPDYAPQSGTVPLFQIDLDDPRKK